MASRRIQGIAAAILCCIITTVGADVLILTDGRRLEGRLIENYEGSVVFDMRAGGATMRVRHPRERIASIEVETRAGPGYCAIPIRGEIGTKPTTSQFVSAAAFRDTLETARQANPEYIVLVINSEGGSVDEMNDMVKAIEQTKDVTFIAYVEEALSAAAVIAMSCPQIYMTSDATIGAAVPYQIGPDGTPAIIEEKFQSAVRAEFRTAATVGGHSPLFLRGMSEPGIELFFVAHQNGVTITTDA